MDDANTDNFTAALHEIVTQSWSEASDRVRLAAQSAARADLTHCLAALPERSEAHERRA
jgi:hypothetical protein